jgi:hypothetical protein
VNRIWGKAVLLLLPIMAREQNFGKSSAAAFTKNGARTEFG